MRRCRFHRRVLTAFVLGSILTPAAAQPPADVSADRFEAAERRCLIEQLATAPDSVTAGEIRRLCARRAASQLREVEPSATVPPADAALPAGDGLLAPTPIEQRFATEIGLAIDRLGFLPHRPNYFMPASWAKGASSDEPTTQPLEVQFQVSLKLPFTLPMQEDRRSAPVLYFAYTGTAWWQAYDSERSAPFREYNHAPELFVQWPVNRRLGALTARVVDFGFEHQSNGRSAPRSRSWNRLFVQFDADYRRRYWASLRAWWRIPEDPKPEPGAATGDDNPDITRFLGHGSLRLGYSSKQWSWSMLLRQSFHSNGKGAVEFNVTYPTGFNPKTRWFVRWFDGYGDSLIDYNRRVQRFGLGLMLNDWY